MAVTDPADDIVAEEHWAQKDDVKLFLYEKYRRAPAPDRGSILFVHGSTMASQATFDLHVAGRPGSSAMDWFAARGYHTWCVDMEGYGRSDKQRDITCDIATGADDLAAASARIRELRGTERFLVYGSSSGALRGASFAARYPERVARLALDAFVWTGAGSPTLVQRRKKLPEFTRTNRRPIDRAFIHSIFTRDHPGAADPAVVEALAEAVLAVDSSIPNGTYIDMCTRLPVNDPAEISVPTLIMRGQYDGIATLDDVLAFYARLPNPDKQLAVMPGIAHATFQQKNFLLAYHILDAFFSLPAPVYLGD